MDSFKNKFLYFFRRAKRSLSSFYFSFKKIRRGNHRQEKINQRLIYNLAPSKIPSQRQFKHVKKFLSKREWRIIVVCLLIIAANALFLGARFYQKNLQLIPAAGGEYVEGLVGYPKTINPLYAVNSDVDSDLSYLIYSRLFFFDYQGKLEADLVESMEISADGKEYIIKIKSGVLWHDGETLNADDILFTFSLIQNSDFRSPLAANFAGVTLEKIDDLTIKFSLPQAYAAFVDLLTFGILPEHLWLNISPSGATLSELNLKPIGSGPFKFKSLTKNKNGEIKEYVLVVNDDYYNRRPFLKNIIFKFFPNFNELLAAFNAGQVDGLSYLPFESRDDLLAQNSLAFRELKRPQVNAIFFNKDNNEKLADKKLRQALSVAIDREALITDVLHGSAFIVNNPLPPFSQFYNVKSQHSEYNLETASKLLQEAEATDLELSLSFVDTLENKAVAEKIKSDWEKLGLKISLVPIAPEQAFSEIVVNRNYQALLYGEIVGADPDVYAFWHSSQVGQRGLNLANYQNKEVDQLLESARLIVNFEDRFAKYQRLQDIIQEDAPAIFLYTPSYSYVQSKKIKGFTGESIVEPSDRFASIVEWHIKTKKRLLW